MQAKAREVYVPPVLQDLRAGTAELHIALEKRLPFFSDTLDACAFERLMQAYYGFYQPLEHALQSSHAVPADFDLTPRLKTATLRRDLHALEFIDGGASSVGGSFGMRGRSHGQP